jgi:HSP20 family protein
MAIIRWEPFHEMNRFFDDDFFPVPNMFRAGWDLAVDVYEEGGSVVAEMNLPGIDPDNIEVTVEDDFLKISGSREEKKEEKNKEYFSREIKRGSFERVVRLPATVKGDVAEAEYCDGVLRVVVPKKEEAKPKKISVKKAKKKEE